MKISERFQLGRKLGQGTFSYIYEAYDKNLKQNVALKIEKKDKNKSILIFEYSVLNMLKGLQHVCSAYDFVKNSEQNLIVMDLLGNNLAKVRKCLEDNYSLKIAVQLLIEMLDAIEEVHDRGFIHRDVKASNFVLSRDNKQVFIVDFGLAKKHLDDKKEPMAQRKKADFRGTVSFASLNAHNNIDLARRDDLWSLYFVILDFLNEKLKWREQKEYTMDEVKHIKTDCLNNPEEKLWIVTKDVPEVKKIFYHLKALKYEDVPDYALIRGQLKSILERNTEIPTQPTYITTLPPAQYMNQQRVNGSALPSPIYIPNQQPQFTVYSHPYTQRPIGYAPNTQQVNQEFQTPERPQNHHRIMNPNAAQLLNQQHQQLHQSGTPLGQDSVQEDGAFPKASPHHLLNIQGGTSQQSQVLQNCNLQNNLAQQYFQTTVQQQRKAGDQQVYATSTTPTQQNQTGLIYNQSIQINGQNPLSANNQQDSQERRRADLKRKAGNITLEQVVRHEQNHASDNNNQGNNLIFGSVIEGNNGPAQSQNKRIKQVTKQDKKQASATAQISTRKKDSKKQNQAQIQIIPDEEPLTVKSILEAAKANELQTNVASKPLQQNNNLAVPSNLPPIFQFSPSNASNVNQQISISQNFYLSPQFLLLLNDHPENTAQILQQAAIANANGQNYPIPGQLPQHTAGILGQRQPNHFGQNNPEMIHNQGLIPMNINNNPSSIFNKVQSTTSQSFTQAATQQQLNQSDANNLFNYSAKYQKTNLQTFETLTETKLKEEQLDGNNHQSNKNTIIQIMQPNSQATITQQKRTVNTQNTFYEIYSQGNNARQLKNGNQVKKIQPPLPPGSNSYYYDPELIEKQNMPCFKIEKTSKNLKSPQQQTEQKSQSMASIQIRQDHQQQFMAHSFSQPTFLNTNLLLNSAGLQNSNINFQQSLQSIPGSGIMANQQQQISAQAL